MLIVVDIIFQTFSVATTGGSGPVLDAFSLACLESMALLVRSNTGLLMSTPPQCRFTMPIFLLDVGYLHLHSFPNFFFLSLFNRANRTRTY